MFSMNKEENVERTWSETIEVTGNKLVKRVKTLMEEGRVRRIIIRRPNGKVLMQIPLTAGVAFGSVMTIFAPMLMAVGALAALFIHFSVEVVRTAEDGVEQPIADSAVEHEKEFA